ncbi:MAG: GEVED domain-containing protein, partial [Saprospiraceae bacterium]
AYCDAGSNDNSFEFIQNVTIGNFSHSSTVTTYGYSDFTNYIITLEQESISELAITNGQPFQSDAILVWIDWNFDGDFDDESELVYDTGPSGENTFFATVIVPEMASRGITRMRIRLHDTGDGPNYSPCGNSQWGEVEDYSILVKGPSPCRKLNYISSQAENVAGTYVDLGNDGVTIPVSNQDNASSDPQEIGFEFEFQCKSFTQFILNTNGFIKLGAFPPSADDLFFDESNGTNGGVFNSDQPVDQHLLIPFNHDLGSGLGGADYRVHTSGTAPDRVCTIQFKNVRDFTTDPLQIFDSIQFQVKLYETSNTIEFIYGDWSSSTSASQSKSAAVGLKGTGNSTDEKLVVYKAGTDSWDKIKFYDRNYTSEEGFNFGNLPNYPEPDAGRTLRFTPTYETDVQVGEIYALGEASSYYSAPQTISVSIRNIGHSELNQLPVMLNVTGANSYAVTKNITSIDFRQNSIIHFNQFIPVVTGFNTITVTVPDDDHNVDNSKSWIQNTTEFNVNYSSSEANSDQAGSLTSSEIYYARYHVTGSAGVSSVKTYFSTDGFGIGQEVFGVVLDENGNEVGRSDHYIVEAGDLGGWHTFTINNAPVITNGFFYAGFGAIHENMSYQLLGIQDENPTRQNTFFTSALDGSNLHPY